jgi:hypothetical protein
LLHLLRPMIFIVAFILLLDLKLSDIKSFYQIDWIVS